MMVVWNRFICLGIEVTGFNEQGDDLLFSIECGSL